MTKTFISFVGASILAALMGCGHGGAQPAKGPDNSQSSGSSEAPASEAPASAPEAGSTSAATSEQAPAASSPADTTPAAQPLLSDNQILQVVHTANQGEIAQAKLAKSKTKDARVKKLAAMMIKDHSDADHKALALAKKVKGLAPSATNASLESDAKSATATLESESGAVFDKGYADTQVKEHQAVLDLIDQQLLPNAKESSVKTFVTGVRARVAIHLQHAQSLQSALAK